MRGRPGTAPPPASASCPGLLLRSAASRSRSAAAGTGWGRRGEARGGGRGRTHEGRRHTRDGHDTPFPQRAPGRAGGDVGSGRTCGRCPPTASRAATVKPNGRHQRPRRATRPRGEAGLTEVRRALLAAGASGRGAGPAGRGPGCAAAALGQPLHREGPLLHLCRGCRRSPLTEAALAAGANI